jgi:ATP-dependent protease ClpP protease subunit
MSFPFYKYIKGDNKMKRLSIILTCIIAALFLLSYVYTCSGLALAQHAGDEEVAAKEEKGPEVFCPATRFTDNAKCMACHQMVTENGKIKFGLKELPPESNFSGKPYCMEIVQEYVGGPPVGYIEINSTGSAEFRKTADYLAWHPQIKKIIVELHTPGGSIMDAWRSIGIIKEIQAKNVHVEMRVYGIAASAGVILLVAGDTRLVNPHAEIMIHKVWTFSMFDMKTPDSSQDQADTLKHFQDNINQFLRDRTNMTETQLDDQIFKKDWWMTGSEAIELGIATGTI